MTDTSFPTAPDKQALEQGDATWPEAAHALATVRFAAGNRQGAAS